MGNTPVNRYLALKAYGASLDEEKRALYGASDVVLIGILERLRHMRAIALEATSLAMGDAERAICQEKIAFLIQEIDEFALLLRENKVRSSEIVDRIRRVDASLAGVKEIVIVAGKEKKAAKEEEKLARWLNALVKREGEET